MKIERIEIVDDSKYAIIIEDKDGILHDRDLHAISDFIRDWWEGDQKFIILAEWGNINIKFERLEKDEN